ncbi:hypothetical protein FSP39_003126, partial [Pinctada imbricata]
ISPVYSPFLIPLTPQSEAAKILARIGDEVKDKYENKLETAMTELFYSENATITYNRFKDVAKDVVDENLPGWRQVALLLVYGQRAAWRAVESGHHGIGDLVDNTARLLAESAAGFIIQQGGWVKAIEHRDSVLTSKQQIDKLNRPGATYFNLNPFEVLDIDPETSLADIKKRYRQMSILVHPDKNQDDVDRAQKAFEAVNKAYKTLENEEGMKRCKEIIDEAKSRVDDMIKQKRKQLKKEGKPLDVPEDEPEKKKHAVYVQTCKLFADLERMRIERETREMHERKRKAEEEEVEEEKKKTEKEWQKNFEESRAGRVDSWRTFKTGNKKSKNKGMFRPPKPKLEKR